MNKKIKIVDSKEPHHFSSIEEYLLNAYGEKKLNESKRNRTYTYLDVIGYTLDSCGRETVQGKYYELNEIEDFMYCGFLEEDEQNVVDGEENTND